LFRLLFLPPVARWFGKGFEAGGSAIKLSLLHFSGSLPVMNISGNKYFAASVVIGGGVKD
jgi:hypothetical protein